MTWPRTQGTSVTEVAMKVRDCSCRGKSELQTCKQLMKSGLEVLGYFLLMGEEKKKKFKLKNNLFYFLRKKIPMCFAFEHFHVGPSCIYTFLRNISKTKSWLLKKINYSHGYINIFLDNQRKCFDFILFMSCLKQLAKFCPNLQTAFLPAKLFFLYKYQLTKKSCKSSHQANSLFSVSPN